MLSEKKYFDEIIYTLDSTFNKLLPMSFFIAIVITYLIYNENPLNPILISDLVLCFSLIVIYLIKNKVSPLIKISIVVFLLLSNSIYSVYIYGFNGSGLIIMILANLLAIIFLNNIVAKFTVVISISSLFLLTVLVEYDIISYNNFWGNQLESKNIFIIKFLVFLILIAIAYTSIITIKKRRKLIVVSFIS